MFFALKVVVWIEIAMIAGWFLFQKAAARDVARAFDKRHLAAVLAIPAICFFSPRLEIIHLAAFLLPLLGRNRSEAVGFYILAAFLFPEMGYRIQVGSLYLLDLTCWISAVMGLFVAYLAKPGPRAALSIPVFVTIAAFCLFLVILGVRGGGLPFRSIAEAGLRVWLPAFLFARMIASRQALQHAMAALLLVGTCLGLLAILEASRSWPIYQEVFAVHGIDVAFSSAAKIRGGMMRAPTTFLESTSFSILLLIVLFVVIWMKPLFRTQGWRLATGALIVLAMLAAMSRGSFIALAFGLLAAFCFDGRASRAAIVAGASAAAFFVLRALAPYSTFLSGVFINKAVSGEADYRVDLFNLGSALVRESPVVGFPLPVVMERLSVLREGAGGIIDFVNTYLFYALVGGIPGGLLFAGTMLVPLGLLFMKRRALVRDIGGEGRVLVSMIAALVLLFAFTSYFERNPLWIFIAAGWTSAMMTMPRRQDDPGLETGRRRPADTGLPQLQY